MDIPVFHDDQHGTAVISGAAIINACEITKRDITKLKVVVVGAGAAGIACAKLYVTLGVPQKNIFMFDSRGLIHSGREGLNKYKAEFAQDKDYGSLEEVLKGADCFLGLSVKNLLSKDMVRSMAENPIIFAMANPDPEIPYPDAKDASPACIMGTGRSDFPNQINNVSGFPYIFRGALDTCATEINEEMKIAAAHALAKLAKEPVPQSICEAYGVDSLEYGNEYVIPKPLDPRILEWVVPEVAKAAIKTGVARCEITDFDAYTKELRARLDASHARVDAFVDSYYKK